MSDRLSLAIEVARAAGRLQRERISEPREIETKSSPIDLVTDVDRASEALILAEIDARYPDDGVLSEEAGHTRSGTTGYRWVVDPLDGTTNYANGIPHFAVSIGIERAGERVLGVVYNPMLDELFSAERGAGARRDGEPISVSKTERIDRAVLATGFAYDVHRADVDNVEQFVRLIKRARAIRRAGSAALDLAYVACGRFDGYWELRLGPWDVAAGYLLVEEAGGTLSDLSGKPVPSPRNDTVAANPILHARLLEILTGAS